jgi:hypothetical protein
MVETHLKRASNTACCSKKPLRQKGGRDILLAEPENLKHHPRNETPKLLSFTYNRQIAASRADDSFSYRDVTVKFCKSNYCFRLFGGGLPPPPPPPEIKSTKYDHHFKRFSHDNSFVEQRPPVTRAWIDRYPSRCLAMSARSTAVNYISTVQPTQATKHNVST